VRVWFFFVPKTDKKETQTEKTNKKRTEKQKLNWETKAYDKMTRVGVGAEQPAAAAQFSAVAVA